MMNEHNENLSREFRNRLVDQLEEERESVLSDCLKSLDLADGTDLHGCAIAAGRDPSLVDRFEGLIGDYLLLCCAQTRAAAALIRVASAEGESWEKCISRLISEAAERVAKPDAVEPLLHPVAPEPPKDR